MDMLPVYKNIGFKYNQRNIYSPVYKDLANFELDILNSTVVTKWIDSSSETYKRYNKPNILKEIASLDVI